jgi:hypothetical protein
MSIKNITKEQRERSLRDRFQSPDALNTGEDPLVRLAALYQQGRKFDQPGVKEKLLTLLSSQNASSASQLSEKDTLFSLHAAIILAQHESFEGIQWILQLLQTATRDELSQAVVALCNCSQFPLAVLLAQSIALGGLTASAEQVEVLMRLSEEKLASYTQDALEEQSTRFQELKTQINALHPLPRRPGRELGLGTIITWPKRWEEGYRYTEFVSVERVAAPPLIMPYHLVDILNRNDRLLYQNHWFRNAGRRVIVAYSTHDETESNVKGEVEALYLLPFASLDREEMTQYMGQIAIESEGLDIAVIADIDKRAGKYRLLTSSGHTIISHYRIDDQRKGKCLFYSELNNLKPLPTRHQIADSDVDQVVRRFASNTTLEKATIVNTWKHKDTHETQQTLVTSGGSTIPTWTGELPRDVAYLIEENKNGRFVFHLPGELWQPLDRSNILQSFFEKQPDTLGVVLETFVWQDGKGRATPRAKVVHAASGEYVTASAPAETQPGTVAYCESGNEGKRYFNFQSDQRIVGGCADCYGTSYRVCPGCTGKGTIECTGCQGSRFIECPNCYGKGKEECGHCSGNGYTSELCNACQGSCTIERDCKNCHGTGIYNGDCYVCKGTGVNKSGYPCRKCGGARVLEETCSWSKCSNGKVYYPCKYCDQGYQQRRCNTCQGTGLWNCNTCHGKRRVPCDCGNGRVPCNACDGKRISQCSCRGMNKGKIVPVQEIEEANHGMHQGSGQFRLPGHL